ncbi:centromere protein V-like [Scylla paramamosain]|uniref:centromere protein V-like n=1 Tax=Scylla paramamosain TaxID=85552 RepID=UPI003082A95B
MSGHDALTTYTFNTQNAKHTFCSTCGVQAFYIPRSNPNGYGIAPHCLDPPPTKVKVEKFDGQNWDESFKKHPNIARRSKEK